MYAVGANGRFCVLIDEIRCLEFWSFCVDIDAMQVYVVGGVGHVSSCFGGLFFLTFCGGSLVVFLFAVFVPKFLA
jgi:hypothetical protein